MKANVQRKDNQKGAKMQMRMDENSEKGQMTVREAGKRGGKKGGATTRDRYGRPFYQEIGTKGGHKVRELIEEGKEAEER